MHLAARHTARSWLALGAVTVTAALALTGCGSGFSDNTAPTGTSTTGSDASGPITVLIGSSGDAETAAVNKAVADWSAKSGVKASVQVANDLNQQLAQGFAAGSPADVFYLSTDAIAGYAASGALWAYGDKLSNKSDFYPSLVQNFTYKNELYCAPKDFSTLALVINTKMWSEAGLTDADVPTTWDQLSAVAKKLTTPAHVGLAFGPEYQRVGVFIAEAGGSLVSADGKTANADSPENLAGLQYVKDRLADGSFAFTKDIGAGWGGEALGRELSAMTIEGNWITGAMKADYPTVDYKVVELPAGPKAKGTMQFTNCWGIAADSKNQQNSLKLVEYLTSTQAQLDFSAAFGPMPSIKSAADKWKSDNPKLAAFLAGSAYATGMPNNEGAGKVIGDFNSQLESLKTGDPAAMLKSLQTNLGTVVK